MVIFGAWGLIEEVHQHSVFLVAAPQPHIFDFSKNIPSMVGMFIQT
jgi:hypothetical protein